MLLYYITDRAQLPGSERDKRRRLLERIAQAAAAGVEYIQLREKDLSARELEALARDAIAAVRNSSPGTKLLINSRTDIALACGAGGVHLRGDDITAADARAVWMKAIEIRSPRTGNRELATGNCTIAVSCHSTREVALAESQGADFAVFAPVFEKSGAPGAGLQALREACHRAAFPAPNTEDCRAPSMPVLALGGVTVENARACLDAGAAGIAGIRLFQQDHVSATVAALRAITSRLPV